MGFKEIFSELVSRAKSASGISSDSALGEALGVSGQSISNAKNNSGANAGRMLSKPLLEELMRLAKYSAAEKSEFLEAWLNWKIERTHDGGLAKFLLSQLKGTTTDAEYRKILKKSADLRHGADVSGKDHRKGS